MLSSALFLPIADVTSDYMAADKHFRRNDTAWGSMTVSLTFMPSILGLVCLSGSWTDKLYLFIFLLPIVQILLFCQQGWKIMKESVKGYMTAWQMISKATKSETKRLKRQEAMAQREAKKSHFQVFKIFESIGEAGPQSILQSSILLKQTSSLANTWNLIMQDYHISPFKSILLNILSSLISLVLTGGAMMVELAFKINGQTVIPFHRLWRIVLHSVLMIPVIIPRVLSLSLIFASFDNWYSVIPTLISGFVYILASLIIYKSFKKHRSAKEFEDVSEPVRMMIITSVYLPCYIINPMWNLLIYQSFLSSCVLSMVLISMIGLCQDQSPYLRPTIIQDPNLFQTVCGILICCLVLGSMVTAFQVWLVRRNHQTFLFQCLYGNNEKVRDMLEENDQIKYDYNEVNDNSNAFDIAETMKNEELSNLLQQFKVDCKIQNVIT